MQKSAILLGLLISLYCSVSAENAAVSPLSEEYYQVREDDALAAHTVMCRLVAMHIVQELVKAGTIDFGSFVAREGIPTDSFTMGTIQKEALIILEAFKKDVQEKVSANQGVAADNFGFLTTTYPALLVTLQNKENFIPRGRTFAERRGKNVQAGLEWARDNKGTEWIIGHPKTSAAAVAAPFVLYALVKVGRWYMAAPAVADAAADANNIN